MMRLKPGQRIGKYELLARIDNDQGANGYVWLLNTADPLVVKFLRFRNPDSKKYHRFLDEIAAMKACGDLDGVLPVIDANTPSAFSAGNPAWYVMPRAETLESLRRPALATRAAVVACQSFASTLAAMHERGISHRDIKPENLFSLDGRWLIGDFGLADFSGKISQTSEGERVGPLLYNAPEMFNNAIDSDGKAADVFSLAKVLWVLLVNRRYPVPGTLLSSRDQTRASAQVEDESVVLLDRLLESATAEDPASRPSASVLSAELRTWLDDTHEDTSTARSGIDISDFVRKADVQLPELRAERLAAYEHQTDQFDQLCQKFLGRLDETIELVYQQFLAFGRDANAQKHLAKAGPTFIPYIISDRPASVVGGMYIWQYVATMSLLSPRTRKRYPLACGVVINQPSIRPDDGGFFPDTNSPSEIGACIYFDDDHLAFDSRFTTPWSSSRSIILGGPSESALASALSDGISENFRRSFTEYHNFVSRQ